MENIDNLSKLAQVTAPLFERFTVSQGAKGEKSVI